MSYSNRNRSIKGTLISFEGIDKTNKTGICEELLKKLGNRAICVHDPCDAWKGILKNGISEKIKAEGEEIPQMSEAFFYLAARLHCYKNRIKPALNAGKIVLADRYMDSWVCYQSVYAEDEVGKNLKNFFLDIHDKCVKKGILSYPDITFLITLGIDEVARRIKENEPNPNKYEADIKGQEKTQECYMSLCKEYNFIHIEADGKSTLEVINEIELKLREEGVKI